MVTLSPRISIPLIPCRAADRSYTQNAFFSSRRRHTILQGDWSSDVCSSDLVTKLRQRFGLQRVILVGDRGMITSARIRDNLQPAPGIDWITALRAPAIKKLASAGVLQLSLFDSRDLAEITHP